MADLELGVKKECIWRQTEVEIQRRTEENRGEQGRTGENRGEQRRTEENRGFDKWSGRDERAEQRRDGGNGSYRL